VRARENRDAEHVHVLLDGGLDDLFGCPVEPRVDHFEARVPERACDDVSPPIVSV